jgi:methylase of polypeptide subunit release factors
LVDWRDLLAEAGLDRVLARDRQGEPPPIAARFQVLAQLLADCRAVERGDLAACVPPAVLLTLEALGLLHVQGGRVAAGYRLVFHCGLWLFCDKVTPSARFYYGNDSLELSRMLVGAQGNVLDLCSGVGAQALVSAQTATHVTAVEIEPLAAKLFWANAAMNGLADKVEILTGDLLDPVAGQRFDLISCNPPFMPVPPGVRYPRFAGGGADGLAIVRRLMAGLPDALTPEGRCEVVGAVLGTADGPDLTAFKEMAATASLALIVDCRTREALEGETLRQLVDTAMEGDARPDVERAFRDHFARLGATHLYCILLHAVRAPSPMVCASFWDGAATAFRMVPFS